VRKLPAGHLLEFAGGRVAVSAYWNPLGIEPIAAWRNRPEGDLLDELDALLTASVKARLISDVPLGAFSPAASNSSIVVALMSKLASGPVKTFTIGFSRAAVRREPPCRRGGEGLRHRSPAGKFFRSTICLRWCLRSTSTSDEPFFDSSAFPRWRYRALHARSHRGARGDGGDELFGGYHYYSILQRVTPAFRLPRALRSSAAQMIRLAPSHRARLLAETLKEDEPLKPSASCAASPRTRSRAAGALGPPRRRPSPPRWRKCRRVSRRPSRPMRLESRAHPARGVLAEDRPLKHDFCARGTRALLDHDLVE